MTITPQQLQQECDKNVTPLCKNGQSSLADCMSLELLKSVERELVGRKMISGPAPSCPLWFLANLERDLFLWRSGRSVADKREFEFWVNPHALIQKRIDQLCGSGRVLFPQSLFGSNSDDSDTIRDEIDYLEELGDRLSSVQNHLEALSSAISIVLNSICAQSERNKVVLPFKRPTIE